VTRQEPSILSRFTPGVSTRPRVERRRGPRSVGVSCQYEVV
jgi:hypothetical protein